MAKYRVSWRHEVDQQWTGVVEADSEREALEELKSGNYDNEELLDEEGLRVHDEQVEGLEEEE